MTFQTTSFKLYFRMGISRGANLHQRAWDGSNRKFGHFLHDEIILTSWVELHALYNRSKNQQLASCGYIKLFIGGQQKIWTKNKFFFPKYCNCLPALTKLCNHSLFCILIDSAGCVTAEPCLVTCPAGTFRGLLNQSILQPSYSYCSYRGVQ